MMPSSDVKRARKRALELAVDAAMPAIALTQGTASCPTREKVLESVKFVLDHLDDPEMTHEQEEKTYQHFHASGGMIVYVERTNRHWHLFQIFVPATERICWYLDEEKA